MAKKNGNAIQVDSIRHKDKRTNIPTEELRDFVADDELAPKTMLYPRDPSLDPQLVWKGKDEQDREDLAVPIVPIYIQEKIHPQAIIDACPVSRQSGDDQPNLFADFNGGPTRLRAEGRFLPPRPELGEPHDPGRFAAGDDLAGREGGPQGEGADHLSRSALRHQIRFELAGEHAKRDVKDGKAEDATRQPEQVQAFRDTWKLGVNSYLAWLRDLLVVAHEL